MEPEQIRPREQYPQREQEEIKLIDQDPYGPSYTASAIQYLPYRIGILVFAVLMIFLGQTGLPEDQVACIEDVILNGLQPVTDFYLANQGLGLTLVSIMQLLVDIELVAMLVFWFLRASSMRYAIVMSIVGISKILLNILFETKLIQKSFNSQAFPSLVFGANFQNTYFFSGVTCLLMVNLLQFWQNNLKKLFLFQLGVLIYVTWVLLSTRQNFFMDIATALVFSHYTFYFINDRIKTIDRWILNMYMKLAGEEENRRQNQF